MHMWNLEQAALRHERLIRLFGPDLADGDESALGSAILALGARAAEMHRLEMDSAMEGTGDGVWPAEAWLTLEEFALLHGIDPDLLDGPDSRDGEVR